MMMDWTKAGELLGSAEHVIVVTHVAPDGDALGSLLGLTWGLRRLGKQVIPAVDGGIPASFAFLPGAADVVTSLNGVTADLIIAVDCGDESRMGSVGQAALATGADLINLDHHVTNTRFGQANLVDTQTVAASEGILDWFQRLGVEPDEQIATCLLTGLVTDTLCFRTSNVTAQALGKAQQLIEAGASLSEITQRTVNRRAPGALQLWSVVLPSLQVEAEGILWVVVDQAARQKVDFSGDGDGGLISLLIAAAEAQIAIVFREKTDGRVEIGFRSVPGYNVANVAVTLGGGGHAQASGCTVAGPLDAAIEKTLALARTAIQEGSPLVS
ncbi:bifunctional oligoribonuclease/PAP phosphatase NrnA [Chloroflexota bacterium]